MSTASDICDVLGRRAMAARIGVKKTAISNAATAGIFPASWFTVVSAMCEEKGIDCPTSLFGFKEDQAASQAEQVA